ncbi:protein MIX23 isoform X2 [Hydra vulgaris]|uniref:Protein MIX23 n=1 Tax=Hydra vulgaris TaxID=6087 RepID=A0ABM4BHV3_HYDVU
MTTTRSNDMITEDLPCESIRHFKESLNSLRLLDDKIVYELNKSNPTLSFQHEINTEKMCQSLYNELLELHKFRLQTINHCIQKKTAALDLLNNKTDATTRNDQKEIKNLQGSVRLLQNELIVEEVIKNRSLKIFNEKCWKSYSIPDQDT